MFYLFTDFKFIEICDIIALPKSKLKLTKEELLQQKRIAEKHRVNRIKKDPIKLAEHKAKEHLKYIMKKITGKRKSIKDMTPEEKIETRKKWREYSYKHRRLIKNKEN